MQHRHGFLHSNKTDRNEPKHYYWVPKSGFRAFVSFLGRNYHRFVNGPNRCIKCNTSMVFCTVMKLTETNQNITVGSKTVDWVRSFRFWPESEHRFGSGPNRCIKCNTGMAFCTITKLTEMNQNITIGFKIVDWLRSFHFWPETLPRFVNGLNRCIKCNPAMVFCTVTKLTETN